MSVRAPVLVAALAAFAVLGLAACSQASRGTATSERCATKTLYGHRLTIGVVGRQIPCTDVREIVRGSCGQGKVWSCFSFRPPDPVLVWFKERERFRERWSTTIEARRYPCDEAHVSATAWEEAGKRSGSAFPTRLQVLADDLMRCRQLEGESYRSVRALLGRPHAHWRERGKRNIEWEIGPERDSFFQIDSEYLTLTFDREDVLESARMVQG